MILLATDARERLEAEAAAYVLDSLPDTDQQPFATHLGGCATCRSYVHSFLAVTDLLDHALSVR